MVKMISTSMKSISEPTKNYWYRRYSTTTIIFDIKKKIMAYVVTIDELGPYYEVPYLFRSHKDRRNNKTAPIEEINKNLSNQNNFGEKYKNVLNRRFDRLKLSISVPIIPSFCHNT